jgi:membrane fusion protein (multidrug efflux system)
MASEVETDRQTPIETAPVVEAKTTPVKGEPDRGGSERPPAKKSTFLRGHPVRLVVLLVVVIAAAIGAMWLWAYEGSFEETDDAQVDGHIYPVNARINGRVVDVRVDNNIQVTPGQVLVQLDPTDYQVALHKAEADLGQSEADAAAAENEVPITTVSTSSQVTNAGASVQVAEQGVLVAQQQYAAAQARVREAEANAAKALSDVERYRPLAQKQEISQQQFEQAQATAKALDATVESAKASADAASRQVAEARARVAQANAQEAATRSSPQQIAAERARAQSSQAAVGIQRANVEMAKLNIQYTTIVAPVAGVIGQRSVQVGQQIQPGQELMSVIPLNDLWITADYKETQLQNMRVGQKATVHVDSTGKDYRGHVDSFPGATGAKYSLLPPENATGNYVKVVQRLPVKIVLEQGEDPDHLLRPGMSAVPKVYVK